MSQKWNWNTKTTQLHVRALQTSSSLGPSIGSPLVGQPGPVPEPNWDAGPLWNPHESYGGHYSKSCCCPHDPDNKWKYWELKESYNPWSYYPQGTKSTACNKELREKYHKLQEFLTISEGVSVCVLQIWEVLVALLLLREVLSIKQLQSNGKLTKVTEVACLETEGIPTSF